MNSAPAGNSGLKTFPTGAVRDGSADSTRYDLITPIGLRRLAETYAEGAEKYGAYNWLKGIPASNLINHALRHITHWLEGDASEDHLAHAVWNLMTVCHFEEVRPELIDIPARIHHAAGKIAPQEFSETSNSDGGVRSAHHNHCRQK